MFPFNRREFLKHSAAISAALASRRAISADEKPCSSASKVSSNDKLRVAVVGVNGRGMTHVAEFTRPSMGTEIVAVCDCDEGVIGKAMTTIEKNQKKTPKYVKDIRKLLEDKSIDIISIATPNHWHSLAAIWAMQAGKDVYCEKPVSHNVREGRILAETARKLNKICQCGTQSRSNPGMIQSIEAVHSGKIGKVSLAYGTCYKSRGSIGKVAKPTAPPKGCDYDLWCGPAPVLPIARAKMHYDWHWTWAYGNGDLGNQGIHEMDKARWGLNKHELPKSVLSLGGRFGYVDDGETANTQLCLFDYGDCHLLFEVRGLKTKGTQPSKNTKASTMVGNIFFGDKGIVVCPSYGSGMVLDLDGKILSEHAGGKDEYHFTNFVSAVRNRKPEELHAEITEGHLSSALCHLGNISYRNGIETPICEVKKFSNVPAANEAFGRMVEHLKDNKVDITTEKCKVGLELHIDPKKEVFTDPNPAAQSMLFREYRKGYEVKDLV